MRIHSYEKWGGFDTFHSLWQTEISKITEKDYVPAAENGGFGGRFRRPFHRRVTRTPGRFNNFAGLQALKPSPPPQAAL